MKKTFLILLLLPVLFCAACRAERNADDKTLLWRITGNGLAGPSYLFGTIHMLCQADYVWTDAMKQGLAASKKVCFEMDLDDPELLSEASNGLADTSGRELRDYFTNAQYDRLRTFVMDSIGLDIAQLPAVSPVLLQTLFLAKTVPCAFPVSYEANIMEQAVRTGKEVLGLESAKEQLDLLNGSSDDSTAELMMRMIDSFSASKAEYTKMLALYKAQDLPALYELVRSSKEPGDDLGAFLDERNKKWIPRMARMMKQSPVFFAVGAAHLYGPPGVISLLRSHGYAVAPVR